MKLLPGTQVFHDAPHASDSPDYVFSTTPASIDRVRENSLSFAFADFRRYRRTSFRSMERISVNPSQIHGEFHAVCSPECDKLALDSGWHNHRVAARTWTISLMNCQGLKEELGETSCDKLSDLRIYLRIFLMSNG